ncbi:MAG: hypothetical protein ACRCUY_12100 [Thermoguttaceae bacterium]
MTISHYSPENLDSCALRLFDIAAELRGIAKEARRRDLGNFPVHDKKAIIWIEQLEIWVKKTHLGIEIYSSTVKKDASQDTLL